MSKHPNRCLKCEGSGNQRSWLHLIPFYPTIKCQQCNGSGNEKIEWKNGVKPPNEIWVQVKDGNSIIEAMAFFGRDGYKPHWELRDGTYCAPSRFSHWREIDP